MAAASLAALVGGVRPSSIFDEHEELPPLDRLYIDIALMADQRMKAYAARSNAARDVTPSGTSGELPRGVTTTAVANSRIDSIKHPDYDILVQNRRELENDPVLKRM